MQQNDQKSLNNETLITLQTKVAYQERTIQELNDQIYQQQKDIDQLRRVVNELSNRLTSALRTVEVDPGSDNENEIPPHY